MYFACDIYCLIMFAWFDCVVVCLFGLVICLLVVSCLGIVCLLYVVGVFCNYGVGRFVLLVWFICRLGDYFVLFCCLLMLDLLIDSGFWIAYCGWCLTLLLYVVLWYVYFIVDLLSGSWLVCCFIVVWFICLGLFYGFVVYLFLLFL